LLLIALGLLVCLAPAVHATMGMSSSRGGTGGVKVVQTFPPDMAQGVSPTTPLTVEFGGNVTQAFYQTINLNLFQGNTLVDGEMFYNPAARQIMFKAKRPLQPGQTYTAHLTWAAGAGNGEKVWNFQVGGTAPTTPGLTSPDAMNEELAEGTGPTGSALRIVQASMAGGSQEAQRPLELTFSEPIDLASLREAPVRLMDGKTPVGIDYRLSRDRKTLTLIPRTPLQRGREYGVTVTTALMGGAGSRLARNVVIPFQLGSAQETEVSSHILEESPPDPMTSTSGTGFANPFGESSSSFAPAARQATGSGRSRAGVVEPAAPATPLKLTGLSPQNNQTVTNLSQPVTIAFSTDIRPETLNEFTFRLEDDFGPVPARIRYLPERRQGVLTPIGVLDAGKTYRVVITQGITDMAGRPLQKGMTTTFATGYPGGGAPEVPDLFAGPAAPAARPTPAPRTAAVPARSLPSPAGSRAEPFLEPSPARRPDQEAAELESFDAGEEMAMMAPTRPAPRAAAPTRDAPSRMTATARSGGGRGREPTRLSSFKVSQILPGANAQAVARDSRIQVHFSEPANPATVNPITISVFGEQRRVEGRVIYDARRQCAIFQPNEPLKAETEYKVLVSDKIRSANGEPISHRVSWQFTTTGESRPTWRPRPAYEADASFDIPLVDGRAPALRAPASRPSMPPSTNPGSAGPAFTTVRENHWAFKSLRHITSKGLLSSFPFRSTSNVTRYEFASALNNALSNLKAQRNSPTKLRLKVADMVELYQLVVEFRTELRSFGVDTQWFEAFMARQGVRAPDVEARVAALNRRAG
jgi:hypothetical protein